MHTILNRYIRKSILLNMMLIFLLLVFLSSIIRLFDELRSLERKDYSVFELFLYTFLNLPKDFELFFPVAILLGGLLGLSVLEIRNELIMMQIFGLSKAQIAISVLKASVFVLLLNVISNEWLLPYSQKIAFNHRDGIQYNTYLFPEKNKNLWLLDNKNNFVAIEYMETTKELLGLSLFYFNKDKTLEKILYAGRAVYCDKMWFLFDINELKLLDLIHLNLVKKKGFQYIWNTVLTPDILSMLIVPPRTLSMFKLVYCIKYFEKIGQNSNYYRLIFWNRVFSPVVGLLMIIIALLYSYGPFYCKKISFRLFFGSIVGFIFYIVYQVSGSLSITYNVSPLIGSITPIILLLIVNIVFLWKYF